MMYILYMYTHVLYHVTLYFRLKLFLCAIILLLAKVYGFFHFFFFSNTNELVCLSMRASTSGPRSRPRDDDDTERSSVARVDRKLDSNSRLPAAGIDPREITSVVDDF